LTDLYIIAVCSRGKNPNLNNCIKKLLEIQKIARHKIEVLLVLNSQDIGDKFDKRLSVCYESKQGYSSVRNKAISMVPKNASVIFLDDDEIPSLSWLYAMVLMHEKYPNDVIFGPVFPNSESDALSYRSLMIHKYDRLDDEEIVKQAGAGNMLIPYSVISRDFFYFDLVFNKSGSEDTDLCFRLRNNKVNIRFAKSAIVYEHQQLERFDQKYLDQRRLKDVSNYSLVIRRNSGLKAIIWRFTTSLIRFFVFSFCSAFNSKFLVDRNAHFYSLKVIVTGRPTLL
jgi:GT2 family glycosyltransferase